MNQLCNDQVRIEQMNGNTVLEYKNDIAGYIFESVKMSNFEDSYTQVQAYEKADELLAYVKAEKAIVLGAFEDKRMIGFLWAYSYPFREDNNRLYVSIVHVHNNYRNMRIGAQMLSLIENIAKDKGFDRIYLHAEGTNEKACRFYEKNDFSKERIQYVKDINP